MGNAGVEEEVSEEVERQHGDGYQGYLRAIVEQHGQQGDGLESGDHGVERRASHQRGDRVHVVHHSGDDLPGTARFVKPQRQPLQMVVHPAPQIEDETAAQHAHLVGISE